MIEDIKEAMKEKRAVPGIRECIKNIGKIEKIFLSSDARQETEERIKKAIINAKSNANCERLGMGKEDISKKLALNFSCEVFSICQKPLVRGQGDLKGRKDIKKEKTRADKEKKQGEE
ncbi:hypothetical protein HYT26_04765 [Candidatus Pacearchaeota archaeon]|nr:hypothetical protein [Candidatus Pacearchaeota archaeon]